MPWTHVALMSPAVAPRPYCEIPREGPKRIRFLCRAQRSDKGGNDKVEPRHPDRCERFPLRLVAQFSFTTTTAYQPGLFLSISPDNGVGGRMSWVSLRDTQDGIAVSAADAPEVDGDFVYYPVALLARGVPHTIKFWIKFNPGPDNDLVLNLHRW